MARGTTLSNLITLFKQEAGYSTSPAVGSDIQATIVRYLQRTQTRLYESYDWPFKVAYFDKGLAAGQQLYDIPTEIDQEGILEVSYKWGGVWIPLERGITLENYNAYDSEEDVRSDPAMRWDVSGASQFEVWPLPATNDKSVRFRALKKLDPLVDLNDRAELDDELIVLFAVAEYLATDVKNEGLSKRKENAAMNRLAFLRGKSTTRRVVDLTGKSGGWYQKGFSSKNIVVVQG